jgi:hypothetical protein
LTRQRLTAGGWNPRHVVAKVVAMKTLAELTEREILALAISSEEEDSRRPSFLIRFFLSGLAPATPSFFSLLNSHDLMSVGSFAPTSL